MKDEGRKMLQMSITVSSPRVRGAALGGSSVTQFPGYETTAVAESARDNVEARGRSHVGIDFEFNVVRINGARGRRLRREGRNLLSCNEYVINVYPVAERTRKALR